MNYKKRMRDIKIEKFLKSPYVWTMFSMLLVFAGIYFVANHLENNGAKEWFASPIENLRNADILLLIIIHAYISRK